MGMKRLAALEWVRSHLHLRATQYLIDQKAADAPSSSYDFFVTMDTDSFIRFRYLAVRLHSMKPNADPRTEEILWGRFLNSKQSWHDSKKYFTEATEPFKYPSGMTYLMSSMLVDTLSKSSPPANIPYP